jgi:hypothetical protein
MSSNANDEDAALNPLWELASIDVMNAQLPYGEIERRIGVSNSEVAAAWLRQRLRRAEQRQRQLAVQINQMIDSRWRNSISDTSDDAGRELDRCLC